MEDKLVLYMHDLTATEYNREIDPFQKASLFFSLFSPPPLLILAHFLTFVTFSSTNMSPEKNQAKRV